MGTSWGQVVKEESIKRPSIAEYTKCQSAVFAYSSFSLLSVTGITYAILQAKLFKPINMKTKLLSSFLLGSGTSWYIAAVRTKFCQELFVVLQENDNSSKNN